MPYEHTLAMAIKDKGDWVVFCVRCGQEIGTLSEFQLLEAINSTRHRGGVLCPGCRAQACHLCGDESQWYDGVGGGPLTCESCEAFNCDMENALTGNDAFWLGTVTLEFDYELWKDNKGGQRDALDKG